MPSKHTVTGSNPVGETKSTRKIKVFTPMWVPLSGTLIFHKGTIMCIERRSDWNYPDGTSYRKDMYFDNDADDEKYDSLEEHQKEKWEEEYEEYCKEEDGENDGEQDDNDDY